MTDLTRRQFLIATAASAGAARFLPAIAGGAGRKRVLTLVFDKGLGAMRAVDRLLP